MDGSDVIWCGMVSGNSDNAKYKDHGALSVLFSLKRGLDRSLNLSMFLCRCFTYDNTRMMVDVEHTDFKFPPANPCHTRVLILNRKYLLKNVNIETIFEGKWKENGIELYPVIYV